MHKLQCLNVAKAYLEKTFQNSMQYLVDNSYWRNSFKDQLQVNYKDWLYKKIHEDKQKDVKARTYIDELCQEQIEEAGKAKGPIKRNIEQVLQKKAKIR